MNIFFAGANRRLPAVTGVVLVFCVAGWQNCLAPPDGFNYDEAMVPEFDLPDPLVMADGTLVENAKQWPERRAEILELFTTEVYGRAPQQAHPDMRFETRTEIRDFLDGKATLNEVRVWFTGKDDGPWMDILLVVPTVAAEKPAGCFLGLNFGGNHTLHADKRITLSESWMRKKSGITENNRALEAGRGVSAGRWPIEALVDRGYALASIYYGDIDPDFDDGFENGIHPAFADKPAANEWGSIAAWSFGLSRALDYLQTDGRIAADKVAVLGHSRLGKTSLWAGATDERFGIVISNDSGCGGAALNRRAFGETVKRINTSFPHWFCDNFQRYNDKETDLPVDQHQLIALMAPRPVYIASATEDQWADPKGEFLSGLYAEPVYALLGYEKALGVGEQPAADTPVGDRIGYHLRAGKHDLALYDWQRYLDFADRHFEEK
jgi:hypothetical protein